MDLHQTLERLPREPGVYLLKDQTGRVLYVGKAKSLHARVRSYFVRSSSDERAFVPLLEQLVGDIETIVTRNEKEALLLENTLIKQHRPRFNIMLRDDKAYLVLRLDPQTEWPRLEVTRRIRDDGARYFGPYHSASDCRQTLRVVNRHFQLRTCSDRSFAARRRPCLQYHIQRCPGPCVFEVDRAAYAQQVEDVTLFLRGRTGELLGSLEARMEAAAAALEFERAARLRDQIAAVTSSLQGQQVVSGSLADRDVVGFHREGERVEVVVLIVRGGKLLARTSYSLAEQAFPDEEMLSAFVSRYYDGGAEVPPEIVVPLPLEDEQAKREWLADLRGGAVQLTTPRRGEGQALLELAIRNARASFLSRRTHGADAAEALAKLQQRLRLRHLPRRIEGYDISGFHEQLVVGSMVVMVDAEPQRSAYRRFKIASAEKDDFAALYEVLARRLRRARDGASALRPGWEPPDLIVVDGGKAQLSMALLALRDLGLEDERAPDVVALAKERENGEPDRVFLPHAKDPLRLRPNTAELFLLARLRDEAHRFAITYHRSLRRKRALRSGLDEIPGIGQKRRRVLLRTLGSLKRIRAASVEELAALPGMSLRAAEAVVAYFHGVRPSSDPAGSH